MKKLSAVLPVFSLALFALLCVILKTSPDRLIGAAFCHQIVSRSPGHGFPFCYRCSGLFGGIFFGLIFYLRIARGSKLFSKRSFILLAAAFLLFMTDILNSTEFLDIDWYRESVEFRFLSAFPVGFFLTGIIVPALHYFMPNEKAPAHPKQGLIESIFFISSWGISYLLIFSGSRLLLESERIILCISSIAFLTVSYCILVNCAAMLRHTECGLNSAIRLGVSAAFLQICLFGSLHILLLPFGEFFQ